MLCQKCKKKDTCRKLCSEAEKYVNQDYTTQKESILKNNIIDFRYPTGRPFPDLSTRSNEENIIAMFFNGGIKQSEVAQTLDVSRQFVNKIVKKYRLIIRENLQK